MDLKEFIKRLIYLITIFFEGKKLGEKISGAEKTSALLFIIGMALTYTITIIYIAKNFL